MQSWTSKEEDKRSPQDSGSKAADRVIMAGEEELVQLCVMEVGGQQGARLDCSRGEAPGEAGCGVLPACRNPGGVQEERASFPGKSNFRDLTVTTNISTEQRS